MSTILTDHGLFTKLPHIPFFNQSSANPIPIQELWQWVHIPPYHASQPKSHIRHESRFIFPNSIQGVGFLLYIILCSRKTETKGDGKVTEDLSRLSALPLSNRRTGVAEFNLLALHLKL